MFFRYHSHEDLGEIDEGEEKGVGYHEEEQQPLVPAEVTDVGEQVIQVFQLLLGI